MGTHADIALLGPPRPSGLREPRVMRGGDAHEIDSSEAASSQRALPRSTETRDALHRGWLVAVDSLAAAAAPLITVQIATGGPPKLAMALVVPLFVLISKLSGLYDRDDLLLRRTSLEEAPGLLNAATAVALLVGIAGKLVVPAPLPPGDLVVLLALLFGSALAGRAATRRLLRRAARPERCLVVGDAAHAERLARCVAATPRVNATVVGHVPLDEYLDDLEALGSLVEGQRVDRVVIAGAGAELMVDAVRLMKGLGVKVSVLPRLFEIVGSSARVDEIDGLLLLGLPSQGLTPSSRLVKRGVDVAVCATLLAALAPLLVLTALAIRLDSPGPLLDRRPRRRPDGNGFELLSFRVTASDGYSPTRVGRALSALSLEGLPQLWNVLRGDMSLVGPQPAAPGGEPRAEANGNGRPPPLRPEASSLRPGVTGLWRLQSAPFAPPEEAVKLDYRYEANWSLWLDLGLLLRSLPVLAEGVRPVLRMPGIARRQNGGDPRSHAAHNGHSHNGRARRLTLSAVVPATNSPDTLDACLAAIRRGSRLPDEIVVVNDAAIKGPAAARNAGAARARGDVLVFVDADVLVHYGAFSRIGDAFEHDQGLTALFGSYDGGDGSTGRVATFRNLLHHHVHHTSPGAASTFWSGLGAVRRKDFLACGGFDAGRFAAPSVEDIDLGVRLRERGARIVLNPKVQGTHLKNWGVWEMVRTDFLLRGVPWIEILLRNRGASTRDLNLSWRHRMSAAASLVGLLGLAARRPRVALAAVASFLTLNTPFYVLLARRYGVRTSTAGVGLHLLHHLVSIAAVPVGVVAHVGRRARRLVPERRHELRRERIVSRQEDRPKALAEL